MLRVFHCVPGPFLLQRALSRRSKNTPNNTNLYSNHPCLQGTTKVENEAFLI